MHAKLSNLYLGWWESPVVFGDETHELTERIGLWTRNINDIFIIWQGTKDEFAQFMTLLNDNNCGLRFTLEIHTNHLPFLDVLISRGDEGRLNTTIYRKPTSTNSLLHWKSYHPVPLKKGYPLWAILAPEKKLLHTCRISGPSRGSPHTLPREGLSRLRPEAGIPKSSHNQSLPTSYT